MNKFCRKNVLGLGDLHEQGLIKEIGLSNTGPKRLSFLFQKLKKRGIKINSIQMQLSLLTKPSLEDKHIKNISDENEIEYLAYSPLGLGILTVPPNESPKPKTFLRQKLFQAILPKTLELRTLITNIGQKYSASQAQVALNWVRSDGAKPIVGIRTPFQAKDASSALNWSLTKSEKESLDFHRNKCLANMPQNPFTSP